MSETPTPRTDACTAHFWATLDDYDIKADAIDNHIEELTALCNQLEAENADLKREVAREKVGWDEIWECVLAENGEKRWQRDYHQRRAINGSSAANYSLGIQLRVSASVYTQEDER